MNREKIKEYLTILDNLSNTEIKFYKELEVAIILFLRSDLIEFDTISNKQVNEIADIIENYSSLLDIDKEEIDYIIYGEENE